MSGTLISVVSTSSCFNFYTKENMQIVLGFAKPFKIVK